MGSGGFTLFQTKERRGFALCLVRPVWKYVWDEGIRLLIPELNLVLFFSLSSVVYFLFFHSSEWYNMLRAVFVNSDKELFLLCIQ